jgi:UDP-galactopyranose mutase
MPSTEHIGMAGAGLSCAVIARELAQRGHHIDIFERRSHVAGNCHTARDADSGVMTKRSGPTSIASWSSSLS